MAKDILDAIREKQAKESAQKQIDDAKLQAKQLIADAENQADKEAEKRYESARVDGDNELIKAKKAAAGKCDLIHKKAENNRESVVSKAVDFILK